MLEYKYNTMWNNHFDKFQIVNIIFRSSLKSELLSMQRLSDWTADKIEERVKTQYGRKCLGAIPTAMD